MRIFVLVFMFLGCLKIIFGYGITNNIVHVEAKNPLSNGFWQKKVAWKARWVKTWQERKYYVPLWKKVWGPIEINEWVPLPKPPPHHNKWSKVIKS